MAKILISPSKYLQGAGEMKNIGTYAAKCGKKALVLISQGVPCAMYGLIHAQMCRPLS